MRFTPLYSGHAKNDLSSLDKAAARHVLSKIDAYCAASDPLRFAKPLAGVLAGLYRFRIGNYRAIFEVDARGHITILYILRITHRKDSYR